MKLVITGGGGFLGQRLAEALLASGSINLPDQLKVVDPEVILADLADVKLSPALDGKVTFQAVDIGDCDAVRALIGPDTCAVFHLAAVVSSAAEADMDLGLRVNMQGHHNVLEACRALGRPIPVVTTSSLAVFGGDLPERLGDGQVLQPESSYGAEKAIGELLSADYSRRGYCDVRTLRLPTVVIRPGKPNAAASSFASSILREPLSGKEAICPVARDCRLWIASPEAAIDAMLHALSIERADWPKSGAVNIPGISTSVDEMLAALERKAGAAAVKRVRFERDPRIEAIVGSWPQDFDTSTALSLGFAPESSLNDMIESFCTRYLQS